jgi:signal transduction histidine kinase
MKMTKLIFQFRNLFLTLGLLGYILLAQGSDYVSARGWVEDPTGTLGLTEIKAFPEQALDSNVFGKGYSTSTYWIRLRIDPTNSSEAKPEENLIVRIRPVYQDNIQLFDPLATDGQTRVTGDFYGSKNDEWQSLNLNFLVPVSMEPRDIWLKLKTHQALKTVVDVLTFREALAADRRQETFSALYLALLLFVLSWATLKWIGQRDKVVGWFIVRTLCTIIYFVSLLGYARAFTPDWFPSTWLDPIFNASLWFFVASAIWFDSKLLKEFQANRWLLRTIAILTLALPVELLTIAFDQVAIGVRINYLVTVVATLLVFLAAISTKAWVNPREDGLQLHRIMPKAALVGMYSLAILLVLYDRISIMNGSTPSENLIDLIMLYPLPMSIFMLIVLQLRAYQQNCLQQAAQRALELSQQEAEIEKKQRLEHQHFLSMLTHELKTPISVAKINLGLSGMVGKERDRIARALKNMNDVVERCRISAAMEHQRLQIEPETFEVRFVLEELIASLGEQRCVKFSEVNVGLINTDLQLYRIIASNLLDNALKYSPLDSTIFISSVNQVSSGISGVSLIVSNKVNSGAMPDLDRLFTKYYRAQSAESKSGSGLGLYICAGIAQMLGGKISCQGHGNDLEFKFWIPA